MFFPILNKVSETIKLSRLRAWWPDVIQFHSILISRMKTCDWGLDFQWDIWTNTFRQFWNWLFLVLKYDCCIFWPGFGCFALQTLVEICFYNGFSLWKAEKGRIRNTIASKLLFNLHPNTGQGQRPAEVKKWFILFWTEIY